MQKYALIAAALATLWWFTSNDELEAVTLPDGSLSFPGYTFSNPERFELDARVLSVKRLSLRQGSGPFATGSGPRLGPNDGRFGGGADPGQSVRALVPLAARTSYPIPRREIETSSANMHMVPANEHRRQATGNDRRGRSNPHRRPACRHQRRRRLALAILQVASGYRQRCLRAGAAGTDLLAVASAGNLYPPVYMLVSFRVRFEGSRWTING